MNYHSGFSLQHSSFYYHKPLSLHIGDSDDTRPWIPSQGGLIQSDPKHWEPHVVLKGLPEPSGWFSGMREMLLEASPCGNWNQTAADMRYPERRRTGYPREETQTGPMATGCFCLLVTYLSPLLKSGGFGRLQEHVNVMGTYACRVMPQECAQGSRQAVAQQRQHQSGPQRPPQRDSVPNPSLGR